MKALLTGSVLALLLLSACSKKASDDAAAGKPMSSGDIAAKMDSVKLEAGEWEATQEIVDAKLSGLPKGVPADAMNRMIGQRTTVKHCVTPEQAANPSAEFLSAQKDVKCDYSTMDMRGGKVKAEMHCAIPQQPGAKMKMVMSGTYLPANYDLAMTVDTSGLPNGMGMVMKMKTSGKRIGDCPAADTGAGAAK